MHHLLALLLLLSAGCGKDTDAPDTAWPEACPRPNKALAKVMTDADALPGETSVGVAGDLMLSNSQAAFVVTEPDKGSTYYYYGGVVVDAVAMHGCEVDGEDKLDEVGIVLGQLNLTSPNDSILRGFKGERWEILNDGADGEAAVVRLSGSDQPFWVVEYTLIQAAADEGGRPLSGPLGIDVVVDYILEPDSPVLRVELSVTNTADEETSLLAASLLSFGGTMDLYGYAPYEISAAGLNLDYGLPWLVATDGEDALAYAVEDGNLAYMGVSGIDVAIDVNQAISEPIELRPGETETRAFFLSVGPGSGTSATDPLAAANPEPLPDHSFTMERVSGEVRDAAGQPVAEADVAIQARADGGDWGTLDMGRADADGAFSLGLMVFEEPWEWRLVASAPGRHDSAPVEVSPGDTGATLELSEAGALDYQIVDGEGAPSPARLALDNTETGERVDLWLADAGAADLAPGDYTFTATRGYEFAPVTGELTVPAGGRASLSLEMQQLVDTAGYISIDTHVHSWDSTDSRTDPRDVLLRAAAHGLDLVVHTEHENIVDRSALPVELGYDTWVSNVAGEEVTATIPEHLTMFPAEPDGSARGGIIEWYGLDIDEIFGMMRARSGGGVNLMNHPAYLDDIGWDRLLAEPTLDDPTLLGLAPGAALWSWDLDGIEVMNGHSSPFDSGNGRWNSWQSMVNAGHPMVAVGCSDDHGGRGMGFPRSYLPASSDRASEVPIDEVVAAFQGGAILSSSGAFARVSLDGAELGELITNTDEEATLSLHVEAIPQIDVQFVSIFINCDEVLTLAATSPEGVVKFSEDVVLSLPQGEDAQVTVAAFGEGYLPAGLPQFNPRHVPRVLTSPIYVDTDGDGVFSAPGGRECAVLLEAPLEAP